MKILGSRQQRRAGSGPNRALDWKMADKDTMGVRRHSGSWFSGRTVGIPCDSFKNQIGFDLASTSSELVVIAFGNFRNILRQTMSFYFSEK